MLNTNIDRAPCKHKTVMTHSIKYIFKYMGVDGNSVEESYFKK